MKRYGCELEFISRINSDGLTVETVDEATEQAMRDNVYQLNRLSISEDTYIANGFNSFVVKLKNSPDKL